MRVGGVSEKQKRSMEDETLLGEQQEGGPREERDREGRLELVIVRVCSYQYSIPIQCSPLSLTLTPTDERPKLDTHTHSHLHSVRAMVPWHCNILSWAPIIIILVSHHSYSPSPSLSLLSFEWPPRPPGYPSVFPS